VFVDRDFIHAEPVLSAQLKGLHVRIINADGVVVAEERTAGAAVSLLINDLGLADGNYRYEVNAIYDSGVAPAPVLNSLVARRKFGLFTISGSRIEMPRQEYSPGDNDQASSHDVSWPIRIAGALLDLVVAEAHAANDGVKAFGNVCLGDPSCDDTAIPSNSTTGHLNDFTILDDDISSIAHFEMINEDGSMLWELDNDILSLYDDDTSSLIAAFGTDGDALLGAGGVFVDASGPGMHIGSTSSPLGQFQITGSLGAAMTLLDADTGGANILLQSSGYFGISNGIETIPFQIINGAPSDALVIQDSGTVSLGAGNAVHVGGSNDPVGQFTITTPAQPRFEMNDTTLGKRWRFSVANDKFAINQLDVAGTEFQVFETGDMLIGGTLTENSDVNAKQDIVPVDRHEVLAKITQLPIAEWSYKDTTNQRHIGPMAQDFHAAFGLGRNNKGISTLDSSGVALAGIQALADENAAIRTQFESVRSQNEALLEQNAELSDRLAVLERQQAETQAVMARMLEAQLAEPVLTRTLAN
jgi:hypothetical protein